MKKIILSIFSLIPVFVYAQETWVAQCEEPKGNRIDYIDGRAQEKPDGFSDVKPIFIFSSESPTKLKFLWSPAEWARNSLKLREGLQEAIVIDRTPDKLTAINVQANGITQMYSLYPSKGLVYFTQHRYIAPQTAGVASTSTFFARCTFTK